MTKIAADEGTLRDIVKCHQAPPTVGGARVMVSVNNVRLLTCSEYGRQPFCVMVHVAPLCCLSHIPLEKGEREWSVCVCNGGTH